MSLDGRSRPASNLVYASSARIPRQRMADMVQPLPEPRRHHAREGIAQDATSLIALVAAGAGLLLAAGKSVGVLDQVRSLGALLMVCVLPLSMTTMAVFQSVAAAQRRTRGDDQPAPVRSIRRHALLWALFAGVGSVAVTAALTGIASALLAGSAVAVSVLLGAEIGVIVGRDRVRTLLVVSTCAVTVLFVVLLGTSGWSPVASATTSLLLAGTAGTIVSRLLCRDVMPGVPVWVRHHVAWPVAAENATVAVLGSLVPVALVVRNGPTSAGTALLVVAVPLAFAAVVARPALAALSSAQCSDARAIARRSVLAAWVVTIVTVILMVIGWTIAGAVLSGVLIAVAVLAGGYLQAQGDVRIPLGIVGAFVAIVGVAVGFLPLVAVGAGLAAVCAITRAARHHRPESRPSADEALPQLSTDPFGSFKPLWSAQPSVDVTIVVPFLNADPGQLIAHVGRIRSGLEAAGHTYEVIAVDDGSVNDAADQLRRVPWRSVVVVRHKVNRGKGGALATGFTRAHGRLIGFIDADGHIDPCHLAGYVDEALRSGADIVLADKTHPASVNGSSSSRQLTSQAMHLVNRGLGLSVVDTQTGAKLYRRELLQEAIPRMWENGFAFDVELFVMAEHLAFDNVVSMPVSIDSDGGPTVSLRSTLRTGVRVLGIARRMALADYHYGPRARTDAALQDDVDSINIKPEVMGS
jgi:hypothetical protein